MKTLYLLRHAKSDWGEAGLPDEDRPLAPRGLRACQTLGRLFATLPPPELAYVSSARRTQETYALTATAWTSTPALDVRAALYLASATRWLRTVAVTDPAIERVLLVGHNPGLHQLVLDLARDDGSEARELAEQHFPTGAFAELAFDLSTWSLPPAKGTLRRLERPRKLEQRLK